MKLTKIISRILLSGFLLSPFNFMHKQKSHKYAVLMAGTLKDYYHDFYFDLERNHDALKSNGYKNFYILGGYGNTGDYPLVRYPAQKESFTKVFNELENKLTENDTLVVYVGDHGFRDFDKDMSFIQITTKNGDFDFERYDTISEQEFDNALSKIKAKFKFVFFVQCYSGGFAKLGKDNTIVIAAVDSVSIAHDYLDNAFFSLMDKKSIIYNSMKDSLPNKKMSITDLYNHSKFYVKEHTYFGLDTTSIIRFDPKVINPDTIYLF